jgi:hypothetical protein
MHFGTQACEFLADLELATVSEVNERARFQKQLGETW